MRNKVTIADRINWFKYGSRIITLEEAMNIVKTGEMFLSDKKYLGERIGKGYKTAERRIKDFNLPDENFNSKYVS